MTFDHRRYPQLTDPDSGGGMSIWLDASDTSTASLKDTTGTSISNGETVGQFISKAGSARIFQQLGASTRPTFVASGINGMGSISFDGTMVLAADTVTGMTSLAGLSVLAVEQNVDGTGIVFGVTVSHDSGNAVTSLINIPPGRVSPLSAIGGRRLQADSFVSSLDGLAVQPNTRNMQGGIFDFANAKLTYTQNGVVMGRQSAFQTAGNTSANAPFAMCLGSFAQEGGTFATPGFKGMVGEVRAWFSARTIDQMAASAAYLRLKWRLPW